VILPDLNLLLYAVNEDSPQHERALAWWTSALTGAEPIGFPWSTVLGFVRLVTHPRIFTAPLDAAAAVDLVQGWAALPHVLTIEPTPRHLPLLRGVLDQLGTAGNVVTDAHLAVLTMEHGATLYSADADFGRFPGLRWRNPLT
jgi:toxin-antitoxin system PIN domain toxin